MRLKPEKVVELHRSGVPHERIAAELGKSIKSIRSALDDGADPTTILQNYIGPQKRPFPNLPPSQEAADTGKAMSRLVGGVRGLLENPVTGGAVKGLAATPIGESAQQSFGLSLDYATEKVKTDEQIEAEGGDSANTAVARVIAGMVTEAATAEGVKALGTRLATKVKNPWAAAATYSTGAIAGGIMGSYASQKIEGKKKLSIGRMIADTLLNFVPGTKVKRGPKALTDLSEKAAQSPVVSTAVMGGAMAPTAVAIENYVDTGELPDSDQLKMAAAGGLGLGAMMGYGNKQIARVFRRIKDKNAAEIDRMIIDGDPDAVALANMAGSVLDNNSFELYSAVGRGLPRRGVGEKAFWAMRGASDRASAGKETGALIGSQVQTAIKKSKNPEVASEGLFDYLSGNRKDLPVEFKGLEDNVSAYKKWVRDYQKELLHNHETGQRVLSEGLLKEIESQANTGDYLTTSYRFFEDAHYKPDKVVRARAIKALMKNGGMTEKKAKNYLAELESRKAGSPDEAYEYITSSNSGILKEKQDLLPELRAYLGEYLEPGEKMAATMSKLSRLVAYDTGDAVTAKSMLDSGLLKEVAEAGDVPIKLRRGIASVEGKELYGSKELQEHINTIYGMDTDGSAYSSAEDMWNTFVSAGKASKVVFNPVSYAPQVWGNVANMAGMAHNPFRGLKGGLKMAVSQFADSRIGKLPLIKKWAHAMGGDDLTMMKKAKERGILPPGVVFSDIEAGTKQGPIGGLFQKAVSPVGKAFSAADITGRYVVWENHMHILRKAIGPAAAELDDKIADVAARMTNDTYQNYDFLNKDLRKASRLGAIPQFASFYLEVFRNQWNQGVITKKMLSGELAQELADEFGVEVSASALRKEGVLRAAAMTTVLGSAAGGLTYFNRKTANEREDQAIKESGLPEYVSGSTVGYVFDKENGKVKYADSSYIIPQVQVVAPFLAAINGGSKSESMKEFAGTVFKNLKPEGSFALQAVIEGVSNRNLDTGDLISASESGSAVQYMESFGRAFWDRVAEPGFIREMERQKTADPADSIRRMAGIRTYESELDEAYGFRVRPIKERWDQSSRSVARARARLEKGEIDKGQYDQEFAKADQDFQQNFQALIKHTANMKVLGLTEDEILQKLRDSGVGGEKALNAYDGVLQGLPKDPRINVGEKYLEMMNDGEKSFIKQVYEISSQDPQLAKSLVEHHKQQKRDELLNISTREKMIRGLNSRDGTRARWIWDRMQRSENPDAVLNTYRQKGLINGHDLRKIEMLRKAK